MVRTIKAVERAAFPQQTRTVKVLHTVGTLREMGAKIDWKFIEKKY